MLAGTIVYVNAGTQLGAVRLARRAAVAGAHRLVRAARHLPARRQEGRRRAQGAQGLREVDASPAAFDRNLVVIGAGSAGLVSALHRRGGEGEGDAGREATRWAATASTPAACRPRRSSRPAKLLSHDQARAASSASRSAHRRLRLRRRDGARAARDRGRSSRTTRSSATPRSASTCVQGEAQDHLALDGGDRAGRRRRSRRSPRARSSSPRARAPFVPPIPGLEEVGYAHLGHALGRCASCRSASWCSAAGRSAASWRRRSRASGSKVTQVEMLPRIMVARGPRGLRAGRARASARKASTCCVGHKAKALRVEDGEKVMVVEHDGRGHARSRSTSCSAPSGASRDTKGYGLEELGIPVTKQTHGRGERVPADDLPEHLRLRRRGRAVPVHPHRRRTWRGTAR